MANPLPLAWGEARIVGLLVEGRHQDAVALLLEWTGPEVLAFLQATLQDSSAARAAFAEFQRDVYVRLSSWNRTGSLRLWVLGQARAAGLRHPPSPATDRSHSPGVIETDEVSQLPAAVGVLAALSPDDRDLLSLRVGQRLPWNGVAEAFARRGRPVDEAFLRSRFEELKALLARALSPPEQTGDGDE